MTLDEAIDKQFENIDDLESVKVRVHCTLTIPTRGGQYGKYFFRDVIHYDGDKIHLKLLPHYSCYKDWKIARTLKPSWVRPDNEFEECVERHLAQLKDVTMGKLLKEIDVSESLAD